MRIKVFENKHQVEIASASIFIELIQQKPSAVLGLATGDTPIGTYREMIAAYQQGKVSYRYVRTFNLDEYVGIASDHPNSYASFMKNHLFESIDIPSEQTHIPDGQQQDLEAECIRYDELMKAVGQIDLQILGIGRNGHIGFNEPSRTLSSKTHVVALSAETRKQNAHHFSHPEQVPTQAITMGVGSILQAKTILLVAYGAGKADILKEALQGPVNTEVPASLLQLHPRVIVMMDQEAGSWYRG